MTALDLCPGIAASVIGRKDPLPAPLTLRARVLAGQSVRQEDTAESGGQVLVVEPPGAGEPGAERGANDEGKGEKKTASSEKSESGERGEKGESGEKGEKVEKGR